MYHLVRNEHFTAKASSTAQKGKFTQQLAASDELVGTSWINAWMGKLLRPQTQLSFTSVDEIYANNSVCVPEWRMTLIFSVPFGSNSFGAVPPPLWCAKFHSLRRFWSNFPRAISLIPGYCQARNLIFTRGSSSALKRNAKIAKFDSLLTLRCAKILLKNSNTHDSSLCLLRNLISASLIW